MVKRQYFLCKDDSDYSVTVNRWIDNDGLLMKWACKIMDQASYEESKKLVPFEKCMFYFYIGDQKVVVFYENTGFKTSYNVCLDPQGVCLVGFHLFYELLLYLYSERVDNDVLELEAELLFLS